MQKLKLLPLVLIFSVLSSTPVGLGQSVEQLFKQGDEADKAGKYKEAELIWRKIIHVSSSNDLAYTNLCNTLDDLTYLYQAIAACRQAIQLNPKNTYAHFLLGYVLKRQGKLEEAITNYRIALSLPDQKATPASTHTLAYNRLGYALQQQGKLPEAIAEYQKAIALDRNYVSAQNNLKEAQRLLAK
ncbi:tetratricopeptide repeat protein [Planktothrix paucivesiculata]|uniref:Tetratricopeptide repeat protein n=1 Tax=Planktothrix paucivesiculata PCC 9631 TaxID=671071 RepID=A0A7Z9C237_9CYAN|nr:tetratricopeptide repeat protein [Planktothrix paucivesiculata]VXD25692.1 exported hypothetical protein [Planktothrix paucivesiculata PCC 9631]